MVSQKVKIFFLLLSIFQAGKKTDILTSKLYEVTICDIFCLEGSPQIKIKIFKYTQLVFCTHKYLQPKLCTCKYIDSSICTCDLKFSIQVYIAKNVYLQVYNFSYVYIYTQVYIALSISNFNFKFQFQISISNFNFKFQFQISISNG